MEKSGFGVVAQTDVVDKRRRRTMVERIAAAGKKTAAVVVREEEEAEPSTVAANAAAAAATKKRTRAEERAAISAAAKKRREAAAAERASRATVRQAIECEEAAEKSVVAMAAALVVDKRKTSTTKSGRAKKGYYDHVVKYFQERGYPFVTKSKIYNHIRSKEANRAESIAATHVPPEIVADIEASFARSLEKPCHDPPPVPPSQAAEGDDKAARTAVVAMAAALVLNRRKKSSYGNGWARKGDVECILEYFQQQGHAFVTTDSVYNHLRLNAPESVAATRVPPEIAAAVEEVAARKALADERRRRELEPTVDEEIVKARKARADATTTASLLFQETKSEYRSAGEKTVPPGAMDNCIKIAAALHDIDPGYVRPGTIRARVHRDNVEGFDARTTAAKKGATRSSGVIVCRYVARLARLGQPLTKIQLKTLADVVGEVINNNDSSNNNAGRDAAACDDESCCGGDNDDDKAPTGAGAVAGGPPPELPTCPPAFDGNFD